MLNNFCLTDSLLIRKFSRCLAFTVKLGKRFPIHMTLSTIGILVQNGTSVAAAGLHWHTLHRVHTRRRAHSGCPTFWELPQRCPRIPYRTVLLPQPSSVWCRFISPFPNPENCWSFQCLWSSPYKECQMISHTACVLLRLASYISTVHL